MVILNFRVVFLKLKRSNRAKLSVEGTPTRSPTERNPSLATPKQRGPSLTTSILKVVLRQLEQDYFQQDFMQLLRLIRHGKFPMTNIAFILLLEVAKWYGLMNTHLMTYRDETLLFFRVLTLFHGSFIRFMSGGKSEGQLLSGGSHSSLFPSLCKCFIFIFDRKKKIYKLIYVYAIYGNMTCLSLYSILATDTAWIGVA